jgi:hypothetical protein
MGAQRTKIPTPARADRRTSRRAKGYPRRHGRKRDNTVELIDTLLLTSVKVVENGDTRHVSTLAAIMLQLWRKEAAGDQKALAVRLKYEEFASQNSKPRLEITFEDDEYTAALARHSDAERPHE